MPLHRFAYISIPLVVLGAVTIASAQSTTTTTTTTIERRAPIKLSPQQRTVIYRTVTRERRDAPPTDVQFSVGTAIPPTIMLSPLPETIYSEVPAVRPLKYFYINDQLVLVDPATSEVVEIIDR